jgi:hypothetical protein
MLLLHLPSLLHVTLATILIPLDILTLDFFVATAIAIANVTIALFIAVTIALAALTIALFFA